MSTTIQKQYGLVTNKTNIVSDNTGSTLDKDDFLQLLVKQLQNQDPSNPMDNSEYIAQLAQFSSLEQMQNVASSIDNLTSITQQSQMIQFNSFVGKTVKYHVANKDATSTTESTVESGTSKITSVQYDGTSAKFVLENGKTIEASNISEVLSDGASTGNSFVGSNSLVESSMLIGKNITFTDDAGNEQTAEVQSVSRKDGQVVFNVVGGLKVTETQISAIAQKA
jgi:flagellar basal-body rod modification protein FlgD